MMGRLRPGVTRRAGAGRAGIGFRCLGCRHGNHGPGTKEPPAVLVAGWCRRSRYPSPILFPTALHPAGHGGADSRHRVRQHREPAARAFGGEAARNGGPTQYRGGTVAGNPAIADREPCSPSWGAARGFWPRFGDPVSYEYALHRKRAFPSAAGLNSGVLVAALLLTMVNGPAVRTRSRPPVGAGGSHAGA